jgi:membrane associated rhomboid family serine protease
MTTLSPEDRLSRAFALDEPPARDLGFTVSVMERVARRRLRDSILMLIPPTLVAAILLWAVVPVLQPLAESVSTGLWPAVPALVVAAFLGLVSWRLLASVER